jgi:hypothetical protein
MNCWSCKYHKLGGINLLGACTQTGTREDVSPDVIDLGCKHWIDKNTKEQLKLWD